MAATHALDDATPCLLCGEPLHALAKHLADRHGIDTREYRRRFPRAPLASPHAAAVGRDRWEDMNGDPYWTRERIIQRIVQWDARYGRPPTAAEWSRGRSRRTYPNGMTRARQDHPNAMTVVSVFGSFNAGIEAAGLAPRPQHRPPGSTRTHCLRGHEFTPENTITHASGQRQCRTCVNAAARARRARQRTAGSPANADR